MNRVRVASAVLTGVILLSLTACGGEEPAPSTDAAPAATATTETTTAAPEATTDAEPADDKALCKEANKAAKAMSAEFGELLTAALQDGKEPAAEDYQKLLTGMDEALTTAIGSADSKVATAMKEVADQSAKAAAAANPVEAADDPAFEKAGKKLTAACKKVGVKVNF